MNRRTYTCPFPNCPHFYASKYNVRRHLKFAHPTYNQFECEECGKVLCSKQNYRQHLHIHTGAKPFVCKVPGCGKCFRQGSQLSIHKRIHWAAPSFEITIPKVTSTQLTSLLHRSVDIRPASVTPSTLYEAKDCILPDLFPKDPVVFQPVPLRSLSFE